MSDPINAFVPGLDVKIEGAGSGPLAGLTFVAKDLFDVAGIPTGGGNPDWGSRYPVPEKHAWAVETLLNAGADLIGKTITDEVSLGILGENPFYGTPVNSAAPDRVPGGSSSGSAAAVAGRLCDEEKRIRLEILTLGRNFATTNLEFKVRGTDLIGRQSQTWIRFPDIGWKVLGAHVSTTDGKPLW